MGWYLVKHMDKFTVTLPLQCYQIIGIFKCYTHTNVLFVNKETYIVYVW